MIELRTIEDAVSQILRTVGEDLDREGLRDTPRRVAEMYRDLFSGLGEDPAAELSVGFEQDHRDLVMLKHIPFYSVCEHHLLPFFGEAAVGYLPAGYIVGASKVIRALEVLARRPQLQERLTSQMADALASALRADGVGVVLQAEHLCMSMRGVSKPGTLVVTSAMRGDFRREGLARDEFLGLLRAS